MPNRPKSRPGFFGWRITLLGPTRPILATRLRYFKDGTFAGLRDRYRNGVAVPLTIEHKLRRPAEKLIRLTYQQDA